MTQNIEDVLPPVQSAGLNTAKNTLLGGTLNVTGAATLSSTLAVTGTSAFTGLATFTNGISSTVANIGNHTSKAAINSSATATAAQVATGYITSTSAAGTTITMPTGTLLGTQLGATQGTVFELYVDNTAGASTVTMAVGTNAVQSDWDNQITTATASVTPAAITPLTITNGVSGLARYTIMFSSATAYVFSRTA